MRSLSDAEITGVMAHELGHVKFGHSSPYSLRQKFGFAVCPAVLGYGLVLLSPLALGDPPMAGVMGSAQAVMLATYMHVILPMVELYATVVPHWIGMQHEDEADRFAAAIGNTTKYGRGLISALTKMHSNSNHFPDAPLFWQLLHDEHPSLASRTRSVEQAMKQAQQKRDGQA